MLKERVVVHRSAYHKVGSIEEGTPHGKKQGCLKVAMAPCEWYRELNLMLLVFYFCLILSILYNKHTNPSRYHNPGRI